MRSIRTCGLGEWVAPTPQLRRHALAVAHRFPCKRGPPCRLCRTIQQIPTPTALPTATAVPTSSPSVTPFASPSACPLGFYGPQCAACPGEPWKLHTLRRAVSLVWTSHSEESNLAEQLNAGVFRPGDTPCSDHGRCSGSGTTGGTGECLCFSEWMGQECDVSVAAVAGGTGGGIVLLASACMLVLCVRQLRYCCRHCWCLPDGVAQPLVANSAGAADAEAPAAAGRAAPAVGATAVQVAAAAYRPLSLAAVNPRAAAAGAAADAAPPPPAAATAPEPQCGICWDAVPDTALGCGHMYCATCAAELRRCAMCRQIVTQRIRIFR